MGEVTYIYGRGRWVCRVLVPCPHLKTQLGLAVTARGTDHLGSLPPPQPLWVLHPGALGPGAEGGRDSYPRTH